jgi:uncharacterized membrane protein
MATPIVSVLLSARQFWLERDYVFVLITVIVLAIIAGSSISGALR